MSTRCEAVPFGTYDDGRTVYSYNMYDEKGQHVSVMNIGCTILELAILDKDGVLRDVVCGMPGYENYHNARSIMNATIGRCANRIADGKFTLNGKEYVLEKNERGINHMHGGKGGFQMRYWEGGFEGEKLVLTYVSPDGEEGYPGTVTVTETITFADGVLDLQIKSTSDQDTIVNYTNHAFFNMNGQESGDTLGHTLMINADYYSEAGEDLIPIRAAEVEGTDYDFRTGHAIGLCDRPKGYDVNYVLRGDGLAAKVTGEKSGITMTLYTEQPDMQFFSGFGMGFPFLCHGKQGATYVHFSGFCLEPHAIPNAINTKDADQVILRKGEEKHWNMRMEFSVEG